MKKYLLIVATTLSCLSANAQDNSVKLNWTMYSFLGNFGLNYERKLNDRMSVNARVNLLFPRSIPFAKTITKDFSDDLDGFDVENNLEKLKFSSFGIHPQFRFYTKGDALSGFYFLGTLGYQRTGLTPFEFNFKDPDDNTKTYAGEISVKNTAFGIGAGIGTQWVTNSGFTFDIIWLQLGTAFGTTKIKGSSDSKEADFKYASEQFDKEIEDVEGFGSRYLRNSTSSYDDNSVTFKFKHLLPYTKLLNFSIGYTF